MKIQLICESCGVQLERERKEHNRSLKLGRKTFCSFKCAGTKNKTNLGFHLGNGKIENLKENRRKQDQYSPFRFFLRKIRSRHKNKEFEKTNITLEYLKSLWEQQNGICPLTGWQLELPKNSQAWEKTNAGPKRASLDRIEPGKPYVIGNIRFVSFIANMCKFTFDDDIVKEFAKAVVEKHN